MINHTGNQKISTLASSEGQEEMPHYAEFHQYLHCLLSGDRNRTFCFVTPKDI